MSAGRRKRVGLEEGIHHKCYHSVQVLLKEEGLRRVKISELHK